MEITVTSLRESAEGREVIAQITEQVTADISKEYETKLSEAAAEQAKVAEQVKSLEAEKAESEAKLKEAETKLADASGKLATSTLTAYRAELFESYVTAEKELAEKDKRQVDTTLIDMAKKRIGESVDKFIVSDDDGGFSKSKGALKSAVDSEITTLTEMRSQFGGVAAPAVVTTTTTGDHKVTEGSKSGLYGAVFGHLHEKSKDS